VRRFRQRINTTADNMTDRQGAMVPEA
jgi:hypothetical protein